MSEFFPGVPKIQYGGPKSRNPLEFKHYNPDEIVGGKTMKDHLRFSVVYWHTFANPLCDPFGVGTAVRPWDDGTGSVANAQRPGQGRLRVLREARRPVLRVPRPRRRPRGADAQGEPRQPRRGRQGPQGRAGPDRRQAALGHRQPLLQPPLHARRGHEPQPRRLRLRRRAGEEGDGGDARARRRGLHLLGRSRGLLDAAEHRHEARARPPRRASSTWPSTTRSRSASPARSTSSPSRRSRPSTSTTPTPRACLNFLRTYDLLPHFKLNLETNHATLAGHEMMHEMRSRDRRGRPRLDRRQHRRPAASAGTPTSSRRTST